VSRKLSIIIPVYNERLTIERVLEASANAPLPLDVARELIVVDDGSVDGTSEIVEKYSKTGDVTLVRLDENHGKGAAIRAGIPHATGQWILIQDGDLEYDRVRDGQLF
jgi:glycosyltransferase involved in cell wall biosynthesis